MDWPTWKPTYEAILADFGWSESDDRDAAESLRTEVTGRWLHVGTEIKHRDVTIVGCSQELEHLTQLPAGVVIAADGATARLRELGVVPRVVVTDLDGDPDALQWAADQGATMVVHAHGDNLDQMDLVAKLGPLVVGTCQCDPDGLEPLRNLGGFTDGDRAVLLAEHYQARRIQLVAFDTDDVPSRYSHTFDSAVKPKKLAWAAKIIDQARARGLVVTRSAHAL